MAGTAGRCAAGLACADARHQAALDRDVGQDVDRDLDRDSKSGERCLASCCLGRRSRTAASQRAAAPLAALDGPRPLDALAIRRPCRPRPCPRVDRQTRWPGAAKAPPVAGRRRHGSGRQLNRRRGLARADSRRPPTTPPCAARHDQAARHHQREGRVGRNGRNDREAQKGRAARPDPSLRNPPPRSPSPQDKGSKPRPGPARARRDPDRPHDAPTGVTGGAAGTGTKGRGPAECRLPDAATRIRRVEPPRLSAASRFAATHCNPVAWVHVPTQTIGLQTPCFASAPHLVLRWGSRFAAPRRGL